MDTRRLRYLRELARHGSMRAVADELGVTTSTVSQQISALAQEVGSALVEPDGRRVRLTPAGRRLADHAITILAAVDAARRALDATAEPVGVLRVAGFATAVRRSLLPTFADLAQHHPRLQLLLHEHEPAEALALLDRDAIDLAVVYDYNLAPIEFGPAVDVRAMWTAGWSLGIPADAVGGPPGGDAAAVFAASGNADWIVNSRNVADEVVVGAIAAMADFRPRIAHHVDSLELVCDLIRAGLGVGLLPDDYPTGPGVRTVPLRRPDVVLRAYAVSRRGNAAWAPLALLLEQMGRPGEQRLVSRPKHGPV